MSPPHKPVIIVHGGAYDIPTHTIAAHTRDTNAAARAGHAVLRAGGTALDAVEAAVRVMESVTTFTAGKGAKPTDAGTVELDAAVMTDAHALGGVASVTTVEHPISLARLVAERSSANLLVAAGAERFARAHDVPVVDTTTWLSDAAMQGLHDHLARRKASGDGDGDGTQSPDDVASLAEQSGHDTVGAVALDAHGCIAAGTSTSGLPYKPHGRVGDSPLAGSGLYVQRGVGGASTTGRGESIMGTVMAKHALDLVEMKGQSLREGARGALDRMAAWAPNGFAGIIAIGYDGEWVAEFESPSMAWACVDRDGRLKGCVGKGVNDYGSALEDDEDAQ